jgi:quinoprotein glucose dehydrogenase
LGIPLVSLGILLLAAWLGLSLWLQSLNPGTPLAAMLAATTEFAGAFVRCSIFTCEVETVGGLQQRVWADGALLPYPPVAIAVDEVGRVYVAEGGRFFGGAEDNRFRSYWLQDDIASRTIEDRDAYYQKWIDADFLEASVFTEHLDRLSVLEDSDASGFADTRHELATFGERLDGIIAGVLVREGEAWVTNVPSVYHMTDADGDGLPEAADVLSTGYGVKTSLQGHDLHGLTWGPDGRIYFSMGDRGYHVRLPDGSLLTPPLGPGRGAVFRMLPDGSELEVFATGFRNPQELAFDDQGNLFTGENNADGGDKARLVYVVEGGDSGWAMPYQDLIDDYLRGPWNAERHWETYHEGQPAWIVPPVAHLANGPAGLAHFPGIGLPERYADHFFLADYRYQRGISQVWSFAFEPVGAGFRLVDEHVFIGNVLATDLAFGFDGRLFVSLFGALDGDRQILVAEHPAVADDPRLGETARLVRAGFAHRSPEELVALLAHPDQRIRLRAQFALASRDDATPLAAAVRNPQAALRARIHALWALGQMGPEALRSGVGESLAWARDEAPELRAQLARVAGEAAGDWLWRDLVAALQAPNARTRFFAAQSLGRLKQQEAVGPLFALLEENADRDAFLRHAAAYALHRIGDVDAALARRNHASRSVRLGALLQLRRTAHPGIAHFLSDPDSFLVVEAARAIYDVPIPKAMPALARLAEGSALPLGEDPQSVLALHRRVIGANRSLGSESAAIRLAAYAARTANPITMRTLALDTLAEFAQPAPRDLAMTWHRPLAERDPAVVHAALDRHGPELIAGDLGGRALEIATQYGRLPLSDAELLALVGRAGDDSSRRVAALAALAERDSGSLDAALEAALTSQDPELRKRARDGLAQRRPEAALAALERIPDDAPVHERQSGWTTLAAIGGPRAQARIAVALDQFDAGSLDPAVLLEVLEAARRSGSDALSARVASLEAEHRRVPTVSRHYALAGGDARLGKRVFESRGDCLRCHGADGHGAGAGPDLAGVVGRRDLHYVLESVLEPQAEIATGFATVSLLLEDGARLSGTLVTESRTEMVLEVGGEEHTIPVSQIRERSPTTSGMPPLGRTLSPRDLRDLVAYIATL